MASILHYRYKKLVRGESLLEKVNYMKLKNTLLSLGVALFASLSAHAVTIDSAYLIGSVIPGSPSSLSVEEVRLQYFINYHNGVTPLTLPDGNTYTPYSGSAITPLPTPLPDFDGNSTAQVGANTATFGLDVTGWDYLLVKWSNDSFYYYVGGLTGVNTVDNDVVFNTGSGRPRNASHYRLFNSGTTSVPDGGMTLGLLGLAIAGLGAFGRSRRIN